MEQQTDPVHAPAQQATTLAGVESRYELLDVLDSLCERADTAGKKLILLVKANWSGLRVQRAAIGLFTAVLEPMQVPTPEDDGSAQTECDASLAPPERYATHRERCTAALRRMAFELAAGPIDDGVHSVVATIFPGWTQMARERVKPYCSCMGMLD